MKKIILMFCLLGVNMTYSAQAQESSCLALNYHRIHHNSWFNQFLDFISNSKEMSIYSVTDESFHHHIQWLRNNNAHFITLNELIKSKERGSFPERCVWLNFDDMDRSVINYAEPILKQYNIPATGFVITGEVGSSDFHNLQLASLDKLQQLQQSGRWSFGSHTNRLHSLSNNNSILLKKSSKEIQKDITKSIIYVNTYLQEDSQALAYPYGQYNKHLIRTLENTKIRYGFTLDEKPITPSSSPYAMPRILINDSSFNKIVKHWRDWNEE